MTEWAWNDGWILMALFLTQGEDGAELHEIIGAADATNHAIPTARELTSAFTKFARCGLLSVSEGRYKIVPEYLSAIQKANNGKGGLFASGEKGLKWLKQSRLIERTSQQVIVNDPDAKSAYDKYVPQMRKR